MQSSNKGMNRNFIVQQRYRQTQKKLNDTICMKAVRQDAFIDATLRAALHALY